jgi:pimeloyl-ACP methyl ester carboxylesterase
MGFHQAIFESKPCSVSPLSQKIALSVKCPALTDKPLLHRLLVIHKMRSAFGRSIISDLKGTTVKLTKRDFLKRSGVTATGLATVAMSNSSAAKPVSKSAFVLVHGAWHGAWCYERIISLLASKGHVAVARDLPAHGLNASFPVAYFTRPINPAAFGTEVSPVAGTKLEDYVTSVLATIDEVRALGFEKVILVGHSMGGVAITAVAERAPEKISAVVYLTAFMPKSGVPAISYIQSEENKGELVGAQFMANPEVVGALRLDPRSSDKTYLANTKNAFYGDVSQAEFNAAVNLLTCDVPVAPFATPINTTASRWGVLPRHYIKCLQDRAILPALQQRFISEADAFTPSNRTLVHEMDSSHSPFISQPEKLARILASIAST